MLKHYTSGSALILDILAILFVACSHNEVTDASNNVSSRPTMDGGPAPVAPPLQPPSTKAQPDYYQRARLKADSAVSIGQSAQSPEDWQLVASRWQQAISLLQAIPPDSPQRTHALTKIAEYQGHLAQAQEQARSLGVVTVGVITANTASDKEVEFSIGNVLEIAVGGAVVRDVQVAISPQLDIGLLGHDFFGNYDIIIRRDVIEFHLR